MRQHRQRLGSSISAAGFAAERDLVLISSTKTTQSSGNLLPENAQRSVLPANSAQHMLHAYTSVCVKLSADSCSLRDAAEHLFR